MKITDIKQQVKRADRYSIFVDGKYSFSLSELGLINSKLYVGQEVSKEELEKLQDTALFDKFYNRVMGLIARRMRSEWEVRDYLKRHDTPALLADEILNKLSKSGYVDDNKFAVAWVNNRRLLKPTSLRRLKLELKQKRVNEEIISEALEADEANEHDVLKELIAKKRRQMKYQDDIKLTQYLIRQGFNYGDIKSALEEIRGKEQSE